MGYLYVYVIKSNVKKEYPIVYGLLVFIFVYQDEKERQKGGKTNRKREIHNDERKEDESEPSQKRKRYNDERKEEESEVSRKVTPKATPKAMLKATPTKQLEDCTSLVTKKTLLLKAKENEPNKTSLSMNEVTHLSEEDRVSNM